MAKTWLSFIISNLVQVDGEGKFQRVSGTNVGGGTYWGLGRLLTKCKRLLQCSN